MEKVPRLYKSHFDVSNNEKDKKKSKKIAEQISL